MNNKENPDPMSPAPTQEPDARPDAAHDTAAQGERRADAAHVNHGDHGDHASRGVMGRLRHPQRKRWLWLAALLVAAALLAWLLAPRPLDVELAPLRVGYFERSVEEDGKTRLRERYVVSAPVAGKLGRIGLREGDLVERGQVIAQLWPAEPALLDERRLQEQREQVAAMEASVQRANASVARAEAALSQAETDQQRSESLAARGFVSNSQVDTARTSTELRRRDLEVAQQDQHGARHQLEQLRIALRRSSQPDPLARQPSSVQAPVAGRVLRVRQESEAVVAAGTPLLELGDPTMMEVLVDLLTEDAAEVKPGAPARLSHWGGDAALEARVRLVEPSAFTKVSALGVEEQRVHVLLDIVSPPEQWRALGDQFRVDVQIPLQAEAQALLVPVSAVFPVGSRSALFVADGGRARQVEVELVARNASDAWIRTSALRPGTSVVAYPPASLKDGQRIRPLKR